MLIGWENFYVIVGSSAGALIGLQFVVMTLIADMPAARADAQASSAFTTPSVVHFGIVLLLSAIVSAPWNGLDIVSVLWGFVGLCGLIYTIAVTGRLRRQSAYRPVFEDWLFHVLVPLLAYLTLVVSSFAVFLEAGPALFLVGAAALLLLFTGIHNAWDIVTYHVFVRRREQRETEQQR